MIAVSQSEIVFTLHIRNVCPAVRFMFFVSYVTRRVLLVVLWIPAVAVTFELYGYTKNAQNGLQSHYRNKTGVYEGKFGDTVTGEYLVRVDINPEFLTRKPIAAST